MAGVKCPPTAVDLSFRQKLQTSLLSRLDLLRSETTQTDKRRVCVTRSMPFEYIATYCQAYSEPFGWTPLFEYSGYDPAMTTLAEHSPDTACHIIWADWRFHQRKWAVERTVAWLCERIVSVRMRSQAPVLVNNWPAYSDSGVLCLGLSAMAGKWFAQFNARLEAALRDLPDCYPINLCGTAALLGAGFFDERNDAISSFPFSDRACSAIAKHLTYHMLPRISEPRAKIVAVDLDNTLYKGVLAEDGVEGIEIEPAHRRVHGFLLQLKQSGLLLAICSKNNHNDVAQLFAGRASDFGITFDDFAATRINWSRKSENINSVCTDLNVHHSSVIFVDDNPAELLEVSSVLPGVTVVLADIDAKTTLDALAYTSGVYVLRDDTAAVARAADVKASAARASLRVAAANEGDYLRSLQMQCRVYVNDGTYADRLREMSIKTNQFNFNFMRMDEGTARGCFASPYCACMVEVSDVISDSGIVGAFIARVEGNTAEVIELLVSCRVLGRHIETLGFVALLRELQFRGVETVKVRFKDGPRNAPAKDWATKVGVVVNELAKVADLIECLAGVLSNHPAQLTVIRG